MAALPFDDASIEELVLRFSAVITKKGDEYLRPWRQRVG